VGCAPAREGGHEHQPPRIGDRQGKLIHLRCGINDLQPIPQPLHHGAGIEQAAFQAIGGAAFGVGPSQGAEQAGIGAPHRGSGVDHEKGAGAVGALGFAWLQAELAQGGRLLIPQQCLNRCVCERETGCNRTELAPAGQQLWQGRGW